MNGTRTWPWSWAWLGVVAWWAWDLQVHWRTLPEFQHGWLVLPLAGYLAWERSLRRPKSVPPATPWGPLALALVSTPCVVFAELYRNALGSTAGESFCLSVGCCGFVLAWVWLQHGAAMARLFLFPLLFMFVAVPIPKLLWNPVVLGLQSIITQLNVEVLNLLGVPAVRVGNVLQLPTGSVGVDEACSGVRSLQSSIMAALFIADLMLRRPGAKVFFLGAGIALALVGNLGRSLYLALTAARHGVAAVDTVHDTAGWSVFGFTVIGIGLLAWWLVRLEGRIRREPKGI